ncbi:MAG: ECF transporter S component [Eubacteriales bacterium]|nr:ECF transporter S component [Eubacteriales bacterium]
MKSKMWTTGNIARIGVLGALSAILYALPGIPVIPPIYKLDFSAVPAVLAGFSMGPVGALIVALIKDLTGLMHSSSMGVGEIADFIMCGSYAVAASLVYARGRNVKSAVLGLIVGTLAMAAAGAAANYWIMVPFYSVVQGMPVESILGLVAKTVPAVDSLWKMILLAVVPFNLLKGSVISLIGGLMYRYIKPLLVERKRH